MNSNSGAAQKLTGFAAMGLRKKNFLSKFLNPRL
jgi:hypothetical protein